MVNNPRRHTLALASLLLALVPELAAAQEQGGILHIAHRDSPASMSTLEEVTISTVAPMMAVLSNLVLFDQHVPQNMLTSIMPDLAESWAWNEDGKELTFRLRQGVQWHDGKPFSAKDVQCTWDMLLGKAAAKLDRKSTRLNSSHRCISYAVFCLKKKKKK